MYGQIHCIIRGLVQSKFGEEKWQQILKKSGLDPDQHFLVFTRFPDPLTYKLVGTVSEELELSMDTVLTEFGRFFLIYCLEHGYDHMLKTLGGDIISFIQNLDSLHALLALSYTGIEAPSFRCEEGSEGDFMLHYYTTREGFFSVVIGLVEAVGQELFNQKVRLTVVSQTKEKTGAETVQHHTCFRVTLLEKRRKESTFLAPVTKAPRPKTEFITDVAQIPEPPDDDHLIKADDFCMAFPYHIFLDEQMRVLQVGDNVRRITRTRITRLMPFNDIGDIVHPHIIQNIQNIFHFINSVFLVAIYRSKKEREKPFLLKGQFVWLEGTRVMIFIASPRLTSLSELMDMKVYLADIPIYDVTRELVLLNQQRIAEIDVAKKLDETTTALQKMSRALEIEKQRTEDLLHEMLPKKVADQLTSGQHVDAEKFEWCTILFSDIVTFTNIAAACQPMDIVWMLNSLYERFDQNTVIHDVYKVETIGDAYMCVSGVPEVTEDHAERIADFAMDMVEAAHHVKSPATGKPLQIRVGMHSGAVVAGVVGKKMPRYCLFGDTVNTSSRMESHGIPGRVHVSPVTYSKLWPYGYSFKERGEIEVKGKGNMTTYFLTGKLDRMVQQPDDDYSRLPDSRCPDPTRRDFGSSGARKSSKVVGKTSLPEAVPPPRTLQVQEVEDVKVTVAESVRANGKIVHEESLVVAKPRSEVSLISRLCDIM